MDPVLVKAKTLLQALWKENLSWDDPLPETLSSVWLELASKLRIVHNIKFPRFAMMPNAFVQVHAFSDASSTAYGACIFLRAEAFGSVTSHLLCSKSKVAPLKTITIPKLEWSAALLLAELISSIKHIFAMPCDFHCWSDSIIVLSWIREAPSSFKIFVYNRIAQIQELTDGMSWHHVPTDLNPADLVPRGCSSSELLLSSKLWKHEPPFILLDSTAWPASVEQLRDLPEQRHVTLICSAAMHISSNSKYQNSFAKLQCVFTYINRFILFGTRIVLDELVLSPYKI